MRFFFTFNTAEIRMYLSADGILQLELQHFLLLFQNNGMSTADCIFDLMKNCGQLNPRETVFLPVNGQKSLLWLVEVKLDHTWKIVKMRPHVANN